MDGSLILFTTGSRGWKRRWSSQRKAAEIARSGPGPTLAKTLGQVFMVQHQHTSHDLGAALQCGYQHTCPNLVTPHGAVINTLAKTLEQVFTVRLSTDWVPSLAASRTDTPLRCRAQRLVLHSLLVLVQKRLCNSGEGTMLGGKSPSIR
ncbi:hypothetical protein BsWGS_20827 [Bradybaena similaris]